jgi:hypothetical protein
MHTGVDGEIYRGEYLLGKRHGCAAPSLSQARSTLNKTCLTAMAASGRPDAQAVHAREL